ncbi:MAG: hypothetical protein ACXQS3_07030 [Candidatus Methanofastidiosia archaeon]
MINPVGTIVIALILGIVFGMSIRGEYFNKKTYATIFGFALFIDIFMGSFPYYTWDIFVELPVSGIFLAAMVGLFAGKAFGGR